MRFELPDQAIVPESPSQKLESLLDPQDRRENTNIFATQHLATPR